VPLLLLWRASCRTHIVDDPRRRESAAERTYVVALLHAHQLAALLAKDATPLAAMVSRSPDGDLLVPGLRLLGVEAVRGSTRSRARDKGGRAALEVLAERLGAGVSALLAVDGPRGPRGRVRLGVAELACRSGAAVVPIAALPDRRWILARSWDRLQIPKPFSRVAIHCGTPLEPRVGEEPRALRERIAEALGALERRCDPLEAARAAGDRRARPGQDVPSRSGGLSSERRRTRVE